MTPFASVKHCIPLGNNVVAACALAAKIKKAEHAISRYRNACILDFMSRLSLAVVKGHFGNIQAAPGH